MGFDKNFVFFKSSCACFSFEKQALAALLKIVGVYTKIFDLHIYSSIEV